MMVVLYMEGECNIEISNTQLNNNKASRWHGGAIYIYNDVQLLITNCSLTKILLVRDGGAIRGGDDVTLEISNTQLNNNNAS